MRKLIKPCFYAIGIIILILYGPYVFMYLMWAFIMGSPYPPSDAEMLENFQENRQAFETVVALVKDRDVHIYVSRDKMPSGDGADVIDVSLRQAHAISVHQWGSARSPRVTFGYWAFGITSGTAKFYLYGYPRLPEPVVADLDEFNANMPRDRNWQAYRHIEGLWYLGMDHHP